MGRHLPDPVPHGGQVAAVPVRGHGRASYRQPQYRGHGRHVQPHAAPDTPDDAWHYGHVRGPVWHARVQVGCPGGVCADRQRAHDYGAGLWLGRDVLLLGQVARQAFGRRPHSSKRGGQCPQDRVDGAQHHRRAAGAVLRGVPAHLERSGVALPGHGVWPRAVRHRQGRHVSDGGHCGVYRRGAADFVPREQQATRKRVPFGRWNRELPSFPRLDGPRGKGRKAQLVPGGRPWREAYRPCRQRRVLRHHSVCAAVLRVDWTRAACHEHALGAAR